MKALTFDDISLIPQYSEILSRHDVNLSCGTHFGLDMSIPILSANMKTVTGTQMAKAMQDCGGLGVLHRFQGALLHEDLIKLNNDKTYRVAVSIGVDNYKEVLPLYYEYQKNILCIDVAHGHHKKVLDTLKYIKDRYTDYFTIIAGNVCTPDAAIDLWNHGANLVKVGVGPGSHCTTRVVTGHGVPQVTAIQQIKGELEDRVGIIADGGIRNSGDIAKAIAVGADYVMIGRLLAGTAEAPSEAVMRPSGLKKVYRGSASYEAQTQRRDKRTIIAEGVQSEIPYMGTVEQVLTKLANGLKSACSYSGAKNLEEFKNKATFVEVSGASYIEGTPHGA